MWKEKRFHMKRPAVEDLVISKEGILKLATDVRDDAGDKVAPFIFDMSAGMAGMYLHNDFSIEYYANLALFANAYHKIIEVSRETVARYILTSVQMTMLSNIKEYYGDDDSGFDDSLKPCGKDPNIDITIVGGSDSDTDVAKQVEDSLQKQRRNHA